MDIRETKTQGWLSPGFLSVLVVTLGIGLRLRQYFANRSLWVDEASLALNIINRSFGGLTQPLDYNQGAPVGFLFIEKLTTLLIGNNEYSLRLFPLIAGAVSVYLMYLITREKIRQWGILAVLWISLSPLLIYYSSEVKQYSSDVLVSLLLVYLSMLCFAENVKWPHFVLLGLAGIFSIGVSHPSIFVLAGIGLILLIEKVIQKNYLQLTWVLGVGLAWVLAWGSVYFVSLRFLTGNNYLTDYWANHFLPLPPWSHGDWYQNAFSSLLLNINPAFSQPYVLVVCILFILIGMISFFARDLKFASLITLPFLIASIASALQKYPLSGRFLLFLVPFAILFMAEGFRKAHAFLATWNRPVAWVLCGVTAVVMLWSPIQSSVQDALTPPMGEHIKPVLAYVQENMQAGDVIYVYSGSVNPFRYYAPIYNLDGGNVIVAENSSGVKRFTADMRGLDGTKRVWLIFSHVIGCGGCEGDKVQFHADILNEYGSQLDYFEATGASVFLYDLTK